MPSVSSWLVISSSEMPRASRSSHNLVGAGVVGIDCARDRAVVEECLHRCHRHRVHGVRADQCVDVENIAIGRVLGAGAGPQWTLNHRSGRGQLAEVVAAEQRFEPLVGELGVGNGHLALERQRIVGAVGIEQLVGGGIDPADEERGDRGDPVDRQSGIDCGAAVPRCRRRPRARSWRSKRAA